MPACIARTSRQNPRMTIPTEMRAAVITRSGGPDVLAIQHRPVPTPGAGEVLVRVRSSALNRADLLQRSGRYPAPPGVPVDIPGLEFAGEVVSSGPGAALFSVGARVCGLVGGGAHAEYLVTHERALAAVPGALDWAAAGSAPVMSGEANRSTSMALKSKPLASNASAIADTVRSLVSRLPRATKFLRQTWPFQSSL